jgi:hypothetical protein
VLTQDNNSRNRGSATNKLFSASFFYRTVIATGGVIAGIGIPTVVGIYLGYMVGHDKWISFVFANFNVVIGIPSRPQRRSA